VAPLTADTVTETPAPPPVSLRLPSGGALSLYTILPSSIFYGVWHAMGGSAVGRILRYGRAVVLQYGRLCRWGGRNTRMLESTIQL